MRKVGLFKELRDLEMVDAYTGPLIDLYPIQPTLKENPSLGFAQIFAPEKDTRKTDYSASFSTGPSVLNEAFTNGFVFGIRFRQILQDHSLLVDPIFLVGTLHVFTTIRYRRAKRRL